MFLSLAESYLEKSLPQDSLLPFIFLFSPDPVELGSSVPVASPAEMC